VTYWRTTKTPTSLNSINLLSYNILTFAGFLVTLYSNSLLLNIYSCSLTTLERWNIAYLSKPHQSSHHNQYALFTRKLLTIYLTYACYVLFSLVSVVALFLRLQRWSLLFMPVYLLVAFVWCAFQLLNVINLSHLMNKINDCYLLVNESSENLNKIGGGLTKSPSQNVILSSNNRNSNGGSTGGQSNVNNQKPALDSASSSSSKFKLTLFLTRLLNYHNFFGSITKKRGGSDIEGCNTKHSTGHSTPAKANIPIHRILSYKGVRHLGSISYRIGIYCLVQTLALAPFVFNTHSPLAIGLYLCSMTLTLMWISLLYQFSKQHTGTCIAYALVAPPIITSSGPVVTFGTLSSSSGGSSSSPTLTKKHSNSNTASTRTTTNTGKEMNSI
jgi:hypothetical protein